MIQELLGELKWSFFEKCLISSEDIRYQKVVIDARVWNYERLNPVIANNDDGEHIVSLKCVFQHLHRLATEQIQILVVFPLTTKETEPIGEFFVKCIELLQVMSIPYIEDVNVLGLIAHLIEKQIVDHCLTDDAEIFLHGIQSAFRYSNFKSEIFNKKQLYLARYYKGSDTSSNLLSCFLSFSLLFDDKLQQNHENCDNVSKVQSSAALPTRLIISRACKKARVHLASTSKIEKMKLTSTGKNEERQTIEGRSKVATKAGMDLVLNKLCEVVLSWSVNPQDRLKLFQIALETQQLKQLSDLEREFVMLYSSVAGKTLSEVLSFIKETPSNEHDNMIATSKVKVIKWKRAEFTKLQDYLKANHISIPIRHLLGYLVAFDFFQLFKSHISGDSYPDGISRPEKVLKVSNKNGLERYDVKWLFIPGTESLSQEDLITTEQKNIFCAAFPKIASKFEGWNLKGSSDDDDDYDGTIRDKANQLEEFCPSNMPGSTKNYVRNKKRARGDSVETPASTSSSGTKSTVKQYFVARKKLIFDAVK